MGDASTMHPAVARIWAGLPPGTRTALGSCAALGAADQNRIVNTARTSEVVSDPTNVLRAQQFPAGYGAHFGLFALVSSGRDRGSHRTELAIKIYRTGPDRDAEVGDGGFVDWTAQLRADAKERCLITCVSTERLV